jgi:hypothetical protein
MRTRWIAAVVLPMAAAAVALVPILIDQPFGTQTPRIMTLAFTLRRWGPVLTLVLAIVAIAAALSVGRRARWWTKALLLAPIAVALGAVWFARQNPFEWMFNALPDARYAPAREASFVEPSDIVLAVTLDGDAAAYPIRQIAYHHVVNDRIGRTPAVVTY